MKASVYTSLFNYSPDKFDLFGAFKNWGKYADEIVIATFEDQRDIIEEEVAYVLEHDIFESRFLTKLWNKIKVVSCPDTSLGDPLFDGKLKNTALQACSNELVIQQDMDERIGGDIKEWERLGEVLLRSESPIAYMIPVIDLYKDYNHYKSVGQKWYFHRKEKAYRGPVNFAKREDGTLDINKSDSCELIDKNGDLVRHYADYRFLVNININRDFGKNHDCSNFPHCIHLGYLDLKKRAEHNKFRKKCWEMMDGKEVEVATSIEKLEEEYREIPHGLPERWWK